jgi:protein-S-isoprenylcysteine O-methyltransferase Ste14
MSLILRCFIVFLCVAILGVVELACETHAGDKSKATSKPIVEKPKAPAKSTAEERNKAFQWFSRLGFLDVKGRKFVRVATGKFFTSNGSPLMNTYVRGFLLEEKGDRFRVLTLSLTEQPYQKSAADAAVHEQVGFDVIELKQGAAAFLKAQGSPSKGLDREPRPWGGSDLHGGTEMFVLAWACWRNGLDDLAGQLFDQTATNGYGYLSDQTPKQPLQKLVADDLAHTEMWRAVVAFGNAAIPRPQLLRQFEHIVKHYPESPHHKDAKAAVALLRQMIKEDADHQKKAARPFDQLDKQEQIADLIFQLRDQNGRQMTMPGFCDIFDSGDWEGESRWWSVPRSEALEPTGRKGDSPAHRLVNMGYDAVPQLIDHLDDERFTRSVGFRRSFYFSHHVLRVNDCALAILEQIAGRRFWSPSSTFSYMSKDKQAPETKRKIQAWYAQVQSEELRPYCLALYGAGAVVALLALLRRRLKPSATLYRARGWRGYIPTLLLPVEWLLPPALIFLGVGEIQAGWLPLRFVAFAVGLCGAALLVWAAVVLGRFFVHDAAVLQDHALITSGPYRFIRHPIYTGYLALLLGTGVAMLNVWLLLLWPLSFLGILVQAGSEERLLGTRFGEDYERYVGRTGQLVPRFWK